MQQRTLVNNDRGCSSVRSSPEPPRSARSDWIAQRSPAATLLAQRCGEGEAPAREPETKPAYAVEIEVERPEGTPESGEEELISIEGEEEIAWEEEEGANLEAQEDPSDRAAGHP
jgi:hypothetical protein